MPTTQSPKNLPKYALHREGVVTADTISAVPKKNGMAMSGFNIAAVQIIPSGGANPAATVYYWSEHASAWVSSGTTVTAAGANVATETDVNVLGRRIFVAITGGAAGGVDVLVGGARQYIQDP